MQPTTPEYDECIDGTDVREASEMILSGDKWIPTNGVVESGRRRVKSFGPDMYDYDVYFDAKFRYRDSSGKFVCGTRTENPHRMNLLELEFLKSIIKEGAEIPIYYLDRDSSIYAVDIDRARVLYHKSLLSIGEGLQDDLIGSVHTLRNWVVAFLEYGSRLRILPVHTGRGKQGEPDFFDHLWQIIALGHDKLVIDLAARPHISFGGLDPHLRSHKEYLKRYGGSLDFLQPPEASPGLRASRNPQPHRTVGNPYP